MRTRLSLARASVLALAMLAALPAVARADLGPALRWSPPPLQNPITVQLGQGVTNTTLDKSRDYVVRLPPYKKLGGTTLQGGRNVVIKGGHISIPPGMTSDAARRGIYIKDNVGTVHIEGVLIDGSAGGVSDGIDIAAPSSTVQVQNVRIVGLLGGLSGFHADVMQPWGGVRELRVDGLTGSSNYQGLYLSQDLGPIGSVSLERVNLFQAPGPYDGGGHLLWITSGVSTCTTYPLSLANVYVTPRDGRSLGRSVWPQVDAPAACPNVSLAGGLSWSRLPVTGVVRQGPAPGGDFVPQGRAGLGYVSPGYRDNSAQSDTSTPALASPGLSAPPPAAAPPRSAPVRATKGKRGTGKARKGKKRRAKHKQKRRAKHKQKRRKRGHSRRRRSRR